jgi:protein-export membrane protein SecD
MEFRMHDATVPIVEALEGAVPPGSEILTSSNPSETYILVRRRALIDGDRLVNAQPTFDQQTGQAVVSIRFDTRGAQAFARVTRDSVGERFAIVLDDLVITAPRINEPILGGSAQISGNFTPETANDLAILLRAGALPAPLTVVEERTVGAELGQDSIEAGQYAAMIGLAFVLIFMIVSYGLFGIFADIALFVNLVLIVGALSLLQATLTLPGIAGIILTVGMAVDANVLIFERIREEIRSGKTPINAVDTGYARAMSTILDANITTLIAAVILFFLGAGPVRGFSVTLGIGIVTSVFTAVTFTRLIVATWLRARRPEQLPI